MELHETLFLRRMSKRSYLPTAVPDEILSRIKERIRWTPSCGNNQPWRMVFVSDAAPKAAVMGAMDHGNEWAAAAPVLVVICSRDKDDWVRPDNGLKYAHFDTGMATLALLLGAVEEGLMAHPTAGWSAPGMRQAIGAPDDAEILCVATLGYAGPIAQLDEHTRKKDEAVRTRKPAEATMTRNRWSFDS